MSARTKPTSQDEALEQAFGAPVSDLYERAVRPDAPPALVRALELRSFLAVAEQQVARVRDRVHQATAADRDMDELSATDLRFDAQWMDAALAGRNGYLTALGELLRSMPPPAPVPGRAVQMTQPKITTALPPSPAAHRAGAAPGHRP
ncbi:hypothetical protein [Streptomyces sp. NPDC003077]|uniref:hypothetical protein n=1 Tax=Streptomyces sp. NPDC003077 TaxID=3154443 RepID=UPI0033B87437